MDVIQKQLLEAVAGLHEIPTGAYNIRANGESAARNTTANIDIVSKTDVSGIDIIIKPGTKKESVHIPVVVSASGLKEMVYNDFFVGVQYHPEFKSRPNRANPIIKGFIKATVNK